MKKSKKNQKKIQFKINWKIIVLAVCLCIGLVIGFVISSVAKKVKAKVLDVAFLELPERITDELKKQISSAYDGKINFVVLDEEKFNKSVIQKKYDLLFSWENQRTESLKDIAKPVPVECASLMPESIFGNRISSVPVLLNHYQFGYNDVPRHQAKIRYPSNMEQFEIYMNWIKPFVRYPFYCAGGNNETLYALITCLVESYGGTEGYEKLISLLQSENMSFNSISNVNLNAGSNSKNDFTLLTVLDLLRHWQDEELLPENWTAANKTDVKNFLTDGLIGVLFSSLEDFRQFPYQMISSFSVDRFSVQNTELPHSLIAPPLVCVNLSDSGLFTDVIYALVTDEVQSALSMSTTFAPVSSHSKTYDRQADDVRFLAAACSGGPKTDAGSAALLLNPNLYDEFIKHVRYYINTGIVVQK